MLIGVVAAVVLAVAPAQPSGVALQYFRGSWDCNGTFPGSGRTISSTFRFDDALAGRGLTMTQDDKPPNAYHAGALWGPSADGKSVTVVVLDVTGSVRRFSSAGWRNGELTLQSDADVTPPQQFVYDVVGDNALRVTWKAERNAEYRIGDVLDCTRTTA